MTLMVLAALFFLEAGTGPPTTAGKSSDISRLATLNEKTIRLFEHGESEAALPVAAEIVSILEKSAERDPGALAVADTNVAVLYDSGGDYLHAEIFYLRALEENDKTPGDHTLSGRSLRQSLFILYANTGVYAKAESILRREPEVAKEPIAPDQSEILLATTQQGAAWRKARFLLALGWLEYVQGGKDVALTKATNALEISKRISAQPSIADALNLSATVRYKVGDYDRALVVYLEALQISESAKYEFGQARNWSSVGSTYYRQGNYRLALENYEKSLAARKRLGAKDEIARAENDLANVHQQMGAYGKALQLREEARQLWEETGNKLGVADVLTDIGWLDEAMGNYAHALDCLQRAVVIHREVSDAWGTADTIDQLALIKFKMGQYEEALTDFREANKAFTQLGNREEQARTQEHIGQTLHHLDKLDAAATAFQTALKQYEEVFGTNSLRTASTLTHLAHLEVDLGHKSKALVFARRTTAAAEALLSNILSFTSEQQRLEFQKSTDPYSLLATLDCAPLLAEAVLRNKGIVLDSLLEDRLVAEASVDPRQREIIEQLRADKQRLTQLLLDVPKDLSEQAQTQRTEQREKLSTEVEQLEAGLARQVAGLGKARRALSVTVAQVQSALPKQSVLVELLRYTHYLGKNKWELRYGAVVIAPAAEPKWVPLGTADEIEKNIRLYQKSVRGITNQSTLSTVLKALQEQVWAPIQKAFPSDATTVIVSPDAELSFVSFATLLTPDDRFVGEKYSIRYVASGRDLLRETKPVADAETSIRVFANPDFAANSNSSIVASAKEKTTSVAPRSIEMRDLQSIPLPELPGTARESAELETRAKKSGWQAQASLGRNATEAELRKVNSPRILHLATHGFFLPEIDLGPPPNGLSRTAADIPKGKLVNPMHRSGLAVAGAQTTLHAWAKGEVPPTENDGIVTAEEVGGLKLDGTWLVVLSACDTGGGEAKAGEGVMGLRRGFVQAGSQNLLMTLWPISDLTTVQIMLDFYDAAFKSGNAPQALADTQRDWLVKLRKEKGLLAAVRLAGPFIMSSQGKQ